MENLGMIHMDRPGVVSFAEAMAFLASNTLQLGAQASENDQRHPSFFVPPPVLRYPSVPVQSFFSPPRHHHHPPPPYQSSRHPPGKLLPISPSKQRNTQAPAATSTAKRSKDSTFTCKICVRALSGDHFYERHLQCINCQMAINSVARTVKVPHADAKRAYIDTISSLTAEEHKCLEDHRDRIHLDAEHRLLRQFPHAALDRSPQEPRQQDYNSPKRAVDAPNRATPAKKRRASSAPAGSSNGLDWQAHCKQEISSDTWGPHHGMMLLIRACEDDLEKLC